MLLVSMKHIRGHKITKWGPAHQDKHGRWQVSIRGCRPGREETGYCEYEHRLVWIEHNGPIPPKMEVHHRNGDMSDNRIENLELISRAEHNRLHKRSFNRTWIYALGIPVSKKCRGCKRVKPITAFKSNGYTAIGTPVVKPRCRKCMEAAK